MEVCIGFFSHEGTPSYHPFSLVDRIFHCKPSSYLGAPIYGIPQIISCNAVPEIYAVWFWLWDLRGRPAMAMEAPVPAGRRSFVRPSAFCAKRGSCALPCGVHRSQWQPHHVPLAEIGWCSFWPEIMCLGGTGTCWTLMCLIRFKGLICHFLWCHIFCGSHFSQDIVFQISRESPTASLSSHFMSIYYDRHVLVDQSDP